MADTIKIGNNDITLKLGSADVSAAYIGDTLVYSGGTQPTFQGKWLATYSDSHTESASCDSSSTITNGEIELTDLVSVEIGDCVTIIDEYAFEGCSGLTSIVIPSGVTIIGSSAFRNCNSLTSIDIPSGVTSIGGSAFYYCTSLTSIDIPDSVTSIGNNTFEGCSGLTSIVIPSGVTSIGYGAFYDCSGLTSVTIGSSVTSIGDAAFYRCTSLTSIDIPSGVTNIGRNAFRYCNSLTSINIPSGVTSIGNSTFEGCSGLTSIVIPDSVTSIGQMVFYGCSSLTSIDIPSGVTSIGDAAFYRCTSLTSIDIPSGVTNIGRTAFRYCNSLTSITVNAVTPPTLGSATFNNTNDCPIYVPAASVNAYKSASGWSEYASRILAIPTQIHYGDSLSNLSARTMRVSTAITLSESHNVTFGDISSNTYSLLYENGNWYNWRVLTNGAFTPDSKTLLTASDGYYTITFDSTYPCLGADADAYGQGGTMFATFDFEIS